MSNQQQLLPQEALDSTKMVGRTWGFLLVITHLLTAIASALAWATLYQATSDKKFEGVIVIHGLVFLPIISPLILYLTRIAAIARSSELDAAHTERFSKKMGWWWILLQLTMFTLQYLTGVAFANILRFQDIFSMVYIGGVSVVIAGITTLYDYSWLNRAIEESQSEICEV